MMSFDDILLLLVAQMDQALIVPADVQLPKEIKVPLYCASIDGYITGFAFVSLAGMGNRYVIQRKGWERLSILLKTDIHLQDGDLIKYTGDKL